MVLKRKLPTQDTKKEKVVQQEQDNQFDMSIDSEPKAAKKAEEGLDFNNDSDNTKDEGRPEDYIPADLRALEEDSPMPEVEQEPKQQATFVKEETTEEVIKQENEDIAPVSFDMDDDFNTVIDEQKNHDSLVMEETKQEDFTADDTFTASFEKTEDAPVKEESFESAEPVFVEPEPQAQKEEPKEVKKDEIFEDSFEVKEETKSVDFETTDTEHANWEEVVDKSAHKDEDFDSFESIKWEDDSTVEVKSKVSDDRFDLVEDKFEDSFGSSDNGGIVPEIPGMSQDDFAKPAEFIGSNNENIELNGDAKKKLVSFAVLGAIVFGGYYVYSNFEETNEVANKWSGALTEANQDIAETSQEEADLLALGNDVTKAEDVITAADLAEENTVSKVDLTLLDSENAEDAETDSSTTEINLLEPKVVEKTSSGKEIIKATGEEEMPDDVKQGANLISGIAAELEKQKKVRGQETADLDSDVSFLDNEKEVLEGNTADINAKVDDQLAEYRKLLAQEQDPGKKVKPGNFFSGEYKEGDMPSRQDSQVAKIVLNAEGEAEAAAAAARADFFEGQANPMQGHQIIEYPQGVARQPDDGIRTLDHFRSLIVEKEDERVRMPKNVAPAMRTQGFPKFKVISIVPNYGLIGEYSGKRGILMIGDTFKGWELIGVYESYAEFKSDTRKHIISLR
jgi:hypothetical protein